MPEPRRPFAVAFAARLGRRFWTRFAIVSVIVGVVLYARSVLDLAWSLDSVREAVDGLGVWGPAMFVGMVTFRHFLLLPHMVVLVAGGLAFGTTQGTIYGAIGIWNAAIAIFLLTRWFGADAFRRRVPPNLQRVLDRASTRGGVGTLALVNAYPFMPLTVFHAAAGLTTMGTLAFAVAIALTSPIRTWTYSYFGSALIEGSWQHIAGATAIALLLLTPLLIPSIRARIRREFALDP